MSELPEYYNSAPMKVKELEKTVTFIAWECASCGKDSDYSSWHMEHETGNLEPVFYRCPLCNAKYAPIRKRP